MYCGEPTYRQALGIQAGLLRNRRASLAADRLDWEPGYRCHLHMTSPHLVRSPQADASIMQALARIQLQSHQNYRPLLPRYLCAQVLTRFGPESIWRGAPPRMRAIRP